MLKEMLMSYNKLFGSDGIYLDNFFTIIFHLGLCGFQKKK